MEASEFSAMPAGGIVEPPRSFWRWYMHTQLRASIDRALQAAGCSQGYAVLELGCGNRPYQRTVGDMGGRYEGADLEGNAHAEYLIGSDGRVAAVVDGSYDIVISAQVLEHVPDPAAYLAEARRLLKPGRWLILSTHGIWLYHPVPTDYWRWTGAGLQKTLTDAGFEVVRFEGLIGMLPAGLHLIQDYLYKRFSLRRRWWGK